MKEERPQGQQFAGGCYIQSDTVVEAIMRSHMLRINPGGEVLVVGPIPDHEMDRVPSSRRERLLSREELNEE